MANIETFNLGEIGQPLVDKFNNDFLLLSAQVMNLQSILGIAPGSAGAAGRGQCDAIAIVSGIGRTAMGGTGIIGGRALLTGVNGSASTGLSSGTINGSSSVSGSSLTSASSTFSQTCMAFLTAYPSSNSGATAQGTITGAATSGFVSTAGTSSIGNISGITSSNYLSGNQTRAVGTITGTATSNFIPGAGQAESADKTIVAQPSQQIFASTNPGSSSTTYNTFALTANPGTVLVNNVADTTQTTAVELYYSSHSVYLQTASNSWFRWLSAGNWTPVASPIPAPSPVETVEGFSATSANVIIYSSSVPGTAAPANATVNNGLETWAITANPGQLIHNGTTDANTGAVVQIYYHNHQLWQKNSSGNWYYWTGTGAASGYVQSTTTPFATTPTINVAKLPAQVTNSTFVVSGTYQDYISQSTQNMIANSSNQGAVVGTPGTLPSGWTFYTSGAGATAVACSVAGIGTDTTTGAALPYVDLTFTGTPAAGDYIILDFDNNNPVLGSTPYYFNTAIKTSGNNFWYANLTIDENDTTAKQDAFTVANTTTLTNYGGTVTSQAGTTNFNCSIHLGWLAAVATTLTMRFAGVQLSPGTTATAFVATPVVAGVPTLQYSDNNGPWNDLTSAANVTNDQWSFVHPPVSSVNSAFTVSVRDKNQTGILAQSNTFSVYTPGVTTLTGITLAGIAPGGSVTTAAGLPVGTVIGQIVVSSTPGSFTGTITCSDARFSVNASYQLQVASVLGASAGINISLTATQSGAAGSPQIANFTIVVSAESLNTTTVTAVNGQITGSSTPAQAGTQLVWTLINAVTQGTTNYQISLSVNGGAAVVQTSSNAVTQLYYINHTFYQLNVNNNWYQFNGVITAGQAGFTQCLSPYPLVELTETQTSTGSTTVAATGQISSLGTNGIATDSFYPTTAAVQLFLIQTFSNGQPIPYAQGPTGYSLSGANAAQFNIQIVNSNYYLYSAGALPAGTYNVTVSANY